MVHHIYANQSNVGDWLSAKGIQSLIAPIEVKEHFCDTPFVAETVAALESAAQHDFIVIGGGGLFMDYFAPFWEAFQPIARRVPFGIWGAGCCAHKRAATGLPEQLLSEIIEEARFCVVRDELTRSALSQANVRPAVACPALVAVTPRPERQHRLLYVDHYDVVGAENYEKIVALAEQFARKTGRNYRQINNLISKGSNAALEGILDLYASADLIVSSRLHGCIIGLAMGRPVLAISGDRKVESFMGEAGLADWVCDLHQIDSLPERLDELPTQTVPSVFLERAQEQNRLIGQEIKALIGKLGTSAAASPG
jgi:polysaccharide pyruvyl transferase WcaK-like protein